MKCLESLNNNFIESDLYKEVCLVYITIEGGD